MGDMADYYAEMAALIAPRPFMVERGHFDGVAPDETVAYEFAKVRHLYNARLRLGAERGLSVHPTSRRLRAISTGFRSRLPLAPSHPLLYC